MTSQANNKFRIYRAQIAIFFTVLLGYISYSLPYPIFSPMFLSPNHSILPSDYTILTRTVILGVAFVLYPLGQFLGNPLIGYASDHYGRKKVLMITLLATGFSDFLVATGISQDQLWLIFLSLFLGGFWAGNITIAQSAAADLSTTATKAKNFGRLNIAMNGGWILGCLLGGKLADSNVVSWFTYATPFYFSSISYLFNFILVIYAFPKQTSPIISGKEKITLFSGISSQLKKKNMALLYAYTLLIFIAAYYYFCYFSAFMVQKFNFGPSQIANFEAYLAVPLIAANYLLHPAIHRFTLIKTSYLSLFALAIGLVIFIFPSSYWSLLITVPIVAIWLTFAEVTSALLVSNAAASGEQGIAIGNYRSLLILGEIIASLTGGYLAGLNMNLPFLVGAIVAVLAGSLLLWSKVKKII